MNSNLAFHNGNHADEVIKPLKKLCGSGTLAPIYSETNEMFIRFHTYKNKEDRKGYKILVEEKGKSQLLAIFWKFIQS